MLWGFLKSHKSIPVLSYVQQMLQCQIPGTGWWITAEWERSSNSSGRFLFISAPVVWEVWGGVALPCLWSASGDNGALPSPVAQSLPAAKSGITARDQGSYLPLDQADKIHTGWVWIWVPAVAQRLSCQTVYENMEMGFACLWVLLKAVIRPQAGLDPWRLRIYLSMNLL